jgi:imidazolonepropionase-like amidohydrolase
LTVVLALLVASLVPGQLVAQQVAIECSSLLDVDSGELLSGQTIVVEGDEIRSISSSPVLSQEAIRIDLSGHTCMPGMIDLHAHISLTPTPTLGIDLTRASADRALDSLYASQKMLTAGFTTLRDPGAFDLHYATVAVKRSIESGEFLGPRLFVAPHALSPTGGHGDLNNMQPEFGVSIPGRVVDGADEIRRAIREEIKYGGDWIKLMVTGGVMSAGDDPNHVAFTREELEAAVDETHRLGRKITVHAIGREGIKMSVEAGVDSVEHGIYLDDEIIGMMKERGTYLVPTLFVLDYIVEEGENLGYPAGSVAKAKALQADRNEHIRHAFAQGVPVAYGSDTIFPHEWSAREFSAMTALGLPEIEAIRSATTNAAELLGIGEEAGSLATGKIADIIAVKGNPLEQIEILEDVRFVMKGGQVVKRPLELPEGMGARD